MENSNHFKISGRITLDTALLHIAVGIFFLTLNLKTELLSQKIVLLQLCAAIPLLLTSILSFIKAGYEEKSNKWEFWGWFTYMLSYAFITNVVGVLIGKNLSIEVSMIFFVIAILAALSYSVTDLLSNGKRHLKERIIKDFSFTLIIIVLGVLVTLGVIG